MAAAPSRTVPKGALLMLGLYALGALLLAAGTGVIILALLDMERPENRTMSREWLRRRGWGKR